MTKPGWQQMQNAVAGQHWDIIISSPLQRCFDFAQQLSKQNQTPFNKEPDWQEINFGDWEGKSAEEIILARPDALNRYYQDPGNNTPKNGEDLNSFLARINQAWEKLIYLHSGKHLLVVTHAGVIRSLFSVLLNLPEKKMFNLEVDHANFTRFQCLQGHAENFIKLIYHNKHHILKY